MSKNNNIHDYQRIWDTSKTLPWCALVTTGRCGSDFFQSLLDGHPEVYGFNGELFHHKFWSSASTTSSADDLILEDILDEYIGHFIHKFKSRYDLVERKNELGEQRNQSIDVDLDEFKTYMTIFLSCGEVNRKDFLMALYISWALILGQDIDQKKLFFHHVHHFLELDNFLEDYPGSKVIAMIRDPRASYVSGVENWRAYRTSKDNGAQVLNVLKRSITGATPIKNSNADYRLLRLEDLGKKSILSQVCAWLGIRYDECVTRSTFCGLRWWGDRISKNKVKADDPGNTPTGIQSNWNQNLGFTEKAVLNYLIYSQLKWFGYPCSYRSEILLAIPIFFAILVPTRYERRLFLRSDPTSDPRRRNMRRFDASIRYYVCRLLFLYPLLFDRLKGKSFEMPFFKVNQE